MHSCFIKMFNTNNWLSTAILATVVFCTSQVFAEVYEMNLNTSQATTHPRALLERNDEYVNQNQKNCLESRSLVSCIKYKASKIIWNLATNSFGYFPNEYGRELRDDRRRIRVIHMAQPSEITLFNNIESRNQKDDGELLRLVKFMKRAVEVFGRNHAIQISLNGDSGARVSTGEIEEGRSKKKQRKWLIILPLIILWKIAHLKMTVVTLLLGVLGLNVLLVGGTAWLIHYLKFKTLCKIHPHLVQSHSHVYDSDPSEYSAFVGSSFPGSHHNGFGSSPHEINGYAKDWGGSSKAYSGYNYLDTISKRLQ